MRADPRSAFEFLLGTQGPDLLIPCLPLALSVSAVLNKSTATASALSDRLAQANAAVPAVHNFSKVKKVGIIGAGVAGLQAGMITNPNPIPDPDPNPDPDPEKAANELRKAGLEVKVFEKSVGVAGVWRANYADFGLQALSYYRRTCYVAIY